MVKAGTLIAIFIAVIGLGTSWAAWGDSTIVNRIDAAGGIVNLNFGMPGTKQQIGVFVVNSNDTAGFHVNFTFANKGMFKSGGRTFPISGVYLAVMGGSLGGMTTPAETALTVDGTTGIATWTPSGTPTSSTEDCVVGIFANWMDQSALLAGFYQENISAVVVSGN